MTLPLPLGRPYSLWLIIMLLLGAHSSMQAQLVANFTQSKTSGCSPLAVTFINTTTGAAAGATYTWNFGNGNSVTTTDAITPVAATYFTPQIYTITLTVHSGVQVSTKTSSLIVYKSPVVDFSSTNTTGCIPLTSSFVSNATPGDGTITNYFWDFGDGNTLVTTSPSVTNTYLFAGTYSVSLTVTNSFGCSNTFKKTNIVTVFPALVPGFTTDSTTLCSLSSPILFNNTSTGTGPLSYSWNFGDGTNSTTPNPSHQYAAKGVYTVQLTVTNPQGCSAKITKSAYINAANFNPDFSAASLLCTGSAAAFADISNPAATGAALWSFGDGGSGIGSNVNHTYATPGSYTVTMTDNFGKCQASQTKTVSVSAGPVVGGFLIDKGASCQSPMLVNFFDTTSTAVKWLWNFTGNPGDTSTQKNPTFLYATNGVYTPTLTVTDANGCSATVSKTLNSSQPTATIHVDTTLIPSSIYCADVNATFRAISNDTIVSFNWTFGDGTSSTSPNPTHLFSIPGTYTINLSFVTNHGCTGTAFPPVTIIVYPKPHAIFTALDSLPCASNQLEVFTNLDDSAAQFTWFYGDGTSDINNNVVHVHAYNKTGPYQMTLIASSPGCKSDTAVINKYITTTPFPFLRATNTCDSNRKTVTLTDTATGASQYIWSFGDGSPNDTDYVFVPQKIHDYPQAGAYTASITATFGPCVQTSTVPVYILPDQHPVLSSPLTSICASGSLPVQISGLDTNFQSIANGSNTFYNIVKWQYNDGTTFPPQGNSGFKTIFNGNLTNLKPGEDSIRVIIQSRFFGCFDTSNYIPIHITGPIAAFGAQDHICYSLPVIFTDSSQGTNGVPIVKWEWKFGDGNSVTRTTNDTVMHTYAFPGTYTPSLKVTDSSGCFAIANLAVTQVFLFGSKADFYWNPTNITPGSPVTFINNSITAAGATFEWHFASDGSTSNNPNSVTHVFSNIGVDTVRLIASATTPGTCADTSIQLVIIKNVFATFTYTTKYIDHANCPPMVAYFVSNTYNTTSLHWDFGDSATADNNPNPSHTYNLPGTYVVTLTAYGPNGIIIVTQDSLTVKGPFGKLYSSLDEACIPAVDTLHATASYAGAYTWDFGDGTVMITQDTFAVHTYDIPGIFTPALILTDSTGCQVTFRYDHPLILDVLKLQLGPPITICDTGTAYFVPQITSMLADSLGQPLTYHWNSGNGNPADTANTRDTSFVYTRPGDYYAQLQVWSPAGCYETAMDTIHVIGPFAIQYPKDTAICIGNSVPFVVQGADSYQWIPNSSLHDIQGGTAIATPQSTTTYSVIGHDKYNCFSDTANFNVIVNPLPTVSVNPVGTILAGTSATLETKVSPDVISWNWAPPNYLSCINCPTPVSVPLVPIKYTVTVATANGCTATADVTIALGCSEKAVHIANAFSPNHDGNNDLFYPTGSGVKIIKYFQVYSRWGQLLFSKKDIPANDKTVGWDGTFGGTIQPPGTYVYMAGIECFTGENFILKGTVELLR